MSREHGICVIWFLDGIGWNFCSRRRTGPDNAREPHPRLPGRRGAL